MGEGQRHVIYEDGALNMVTLIADIESNGDCPRVTIEEKVLGEPDRDVMLVGADQIRLVAQLLGRFLKTYNL